MHIQGQERNIPKSDREVFEFLTDLRNFEVLMPENIEKFEILDEKTFKFALKAMPETVLRLKEQQPHQPEFLGAPRYNLPFTLTADIPALDGEPPQDDLT